MQDRPAHLNLEWVAVSKRRLYTVAARSALLALVLTAGLYLWLGGHPFGASGAELRPVEGMRFYTHAGEVRVVRATTREVIVVDDETRLYPGDTVQTQQTGRASVTLADGSILSIRPDSVITINNNERASDGQAANVRVAVDRGQINLRTDHQTPAMSNVVESPLTRSRLAAQTAATFDVHEDRREEIRVNSGAVSTRTRGGEAATLKGGEYLALNQLGAVVRREALLEAPVPYAPRHAETITAGRRGLADITLRWARPSVGPATDYEIELATSPFFVPDGMVLKRGQLVQPELIVTELRPGNYFWRVCVASSTGQTSEWSETQKFTITSPPLAPVERGRAP